mmetsp:Transcript_11606/g.10271  ORF Transcript_11606/g.10271 Transcript_11606/m.10271 type:complete len:93 (+) Transcript_11606:265-543(+)
MLTFMGADGIRYLKKKYSNKENLKVVHPKIKEYKIDEDTKAKNQFSTKTQEEFKDSYQIFPRPQSKAGEKVIKLDIPLYSSKSLFRKTISDC